VIRAWPAAACAGPCDPALAQAMAALAAFGRQIRPAHFVPGVRKLRAAEFLRDQEGKGK